MYIWETNLDLSAKILELSSEHSNFSEKEGFNRIVVHSSYYACLHKMLELNELFDLVTKSGGKDSHINIIDQIHSYPSEKIDGKTKREISHLMRKLKEYRRKADYESGHSNLFKHNSVASILEEARITFNMLNSI